MAKSSADISQSAQRGIALPQGFVERRSYVKRVSTLREEGASSQGVEGAATWNDVSTQREEGTPPQSVVERRYYVKGATT